MKKTVLMLTFLAFIIIVACAPPEGAMAGQAVRPDTLSLCNQNAACKSAYNTCLQTKCNLIRNNLQVTQCQNSCLVSASASSSTTPAPITASPATNPANSATPIPPDSAATPMPEYTLALDTACRRSQACQGLYNGCMQATCAILAANSPTNSLVSCRHNCSVSATAGRAFPVLPCADANPNFCNTRDTCTAAGNFWVIGHEELASTYNQCTDTCPYGTVANPGTHLCVIPDGSACFWVHPEQCNSGYCNYYANNRVGACEPSRICEANWQCTQWGACHNEPNPVYVVDTTPATVNVRTRTCTDTNLCGWAAAVASRPTETELCSGTAY